MPNILSFRNAYAWALIAVLSAAILSLFISVQLGVVAMLWAVIAWWTWVNPEIAVIFLVIIAPLLPIVKATQTLSIITLTKDVIILTLFASTFAWPLLKQRLPYRRSLFIIPLFILGLWVVLALLRADSHTLGILRARDIFLYAMFYFGVLYLPLKPRFYFELYKWFLASFSIVLLLGAYQMRFAVDSTTLRFDPGKSIWIPRISSVLGHPSVFGQYVTFAAALFLSIAIITKSKSAKLFHVLLVLLCMPFIYLTYSRAVWIAFAMSLGAVGVTYTWQLMRRYPAFSLKKFLPSIGVATGALVLVLILALRFTSAGTFLRSAFDPNYSSNQIRLDFVARLIASVSNTEALIGRGLGDVVTQNFRVADVNSYDIASGAAQAVQESKDNTLVDNQYLKTFIEMGFPGLVIYAWIYWRFFRGSTRLLQHESSLSKIIGLWGVGFIGAFIIQAAFTDVWDIFPTNIFFWLVAALISANQIVSISDESENSAKP